jgi:hypothetical protein
MLHTVCPMQRDVRLFKSASVVFTQLPESCESRKKWAGDVSKRRGKCTNEDAEKKSSNESEEEKLNSEYTCWET